MLSSRGKKKWEGKWGNEETCWGGYHSSRFIHQCMSGGLMYWMNDRSREMCGLLFWQTDRKKCSLIWYTDVKYVVHCIGKQTERNVHWPDVQVWIWLICNWNKCNNTAATQRELYMCHCSTLLLVDKMWGNAETFNENFQKFCVVLNNYKWNGFEVL